MLPILLALAFIALIFIIVITGRPDEFTVTRAASIAAPPDSRTRSGWQFNLPTRKELKKLHRSVQQMLNSDRI